MVGEVHGRDATRRWTDDLVVAYLGVMLSSAIAGLSLFVADGMRNAGLGAKLPLIAFWLVAAVFLIKPAAYSVWVVRRFTAQGAGAARVALAVGSLAFWLVVLVAVMVWRLR